MPRNAAFDDVCTRCHGDIIRGQEIVPSGRGGWMHRGCASGQDDE